ncbi:MAG: hypothetical protein JNL05_10050 [Flavobacteriales bacterium]|nr:hypothetical protein [Flavobacteriales bacterium]
MRLPLALPLLVLSATAAAQEPVLNFTDMQPMQGAWSGELMYIDYTGGAETHIPATLLLTPMDQYHWRIGFGYTEEPQANALDTLVLAEDGRTLDGFTVLEVQRYTTDSLRFVLQAEGEDDHKPATLRKTWTLGPHTCTLRKEVRFVALNGEAMPFFLRHEYRFKR